MKLRGDNIKEREELEWKAKLEYVESESISDIFPAYYTYCTTFSAIHGNVYYSKQ